MKNTWNRMWTAGLALLSVLSLPGVAAEESNPDNHFDKYEVVVSVDKNGKTTIQKNTVLHIGDSLQNVPGVIGVHDNSLERLLEYKGAVYRDGDRRKTIRKDDLVRVNASNADVISQSSVLVASLEDELRRGDYVEETSRHEYTLPFLGFDFTPAEVPMPADLVHLQIRIADDSKKILKIFNDTQPVQGKPDKNGMVYDFEWKDVRMSTELRRSGEKFNRRPVVFLQAFQYRVDPKQPLYALSDWKDFGNYYLALIGGKIEEAAARELAQKITAGKTTAREKMDAIFAYCQKNVRYEQVYLEKGEIIPNTYSSIIGKRFGDCKDYALVIYTLGRSIGLKPDLALCFRGRGRQFFAEMPVSQFNHMIVHYADEAGECWYDGTNRSGEPGIVSSDLIHQWALVLETGNSRLVQIAESPDNLLQIGGKLRENGGALVGELEIRLVAQFATEFFLEDTYLNSADMRDMMHNWLTQNIHSRAVLRTNRWRREGNAFVITLGCEFPSSVIRIDRDAYVSLGRLFDRLLPSDLPVGDGAALFYFPNYNRVKIELKLEGLREAAAAPGQGFTWKYAYALPIGPFDDAGRAAFAPLWQETVEQFRKKIKLVKEVQ